ncbi:abhydrolase domain-containing protein C22H12.03 [Caerostris extrusa]|uniref:sn-1-specific diacylglycerol lipase ABHD11 n=1 Tax=Caerostris extrusa TaxID=172846 RepID=A0AAV4QC80_CAEEX|nr:abhydrolase domain-containing protein C22H12.03 [Caerostris extrusa]
MGRLPSNKSQIKVDLNHSCGSSLPKVGQNCSFTFSTPVIIMAKYNPVPLAYNSLEPEDWDKDKAPVIFLHGMMGYKEYWNEIPQAVAKATHRKVYAVDASNHGDSPWTDVFNFDVNTDDLLLFMDTIKAPKAILVGHSMGGVTSMQTAIRVPERIEKIVVEDMTASDLPMQIAVLLKKQFPLIREAIDSIPPELDEVEARKFIVDFLAKYIPQPPDSDEKPEYKGIVFPLKRNEDGKYVSKANLDTIQKALDDPKNLQSNISGVYEGPVSFIYGTASHLSISGDEERIKKHFPNAELVGIDGASHMVHSDCPLEFLVALLNFLQYE